MNLYHFDLEHSDFIVMSESAGDARDTIAMEYRDTRHISSLIAELREIDPEVYGINDSIAFDK